MNGRLQGRVWETTAGAFAAGLVTAFFYAMLAPRSEPRGD